MIDVFRVGVHLGFTSNGEAALGSLMRELFRLHHGVDGLIGKMDRLKVVAAGALTALAGGFALRGIWHMVEASKELNKELNRTRQIGGDFARTVGDARRVAISTTRLVPTTTPAENVRVQRELATQLRSPEEAQRILPMAQEAAYVISNYTGESTETITKNLVKIADIRAQIMRRGSDGRDVVDPAKVAKEFEAASRGLILGGGYINSAGLLQLARQAGVPAKTMTAEAFYANAVEMSVSQGASRTGTAITSLFSQMIGGTMPVHVATEMQRMGMLNQGDWHSDHGHVVLSSQATERFRGIQTDAIGYITGPLDQLLTARGMNSQQKLEEVFKLFGRQTTQRLVAEALSGEPQFARQRSIYGGIPGVHEQYAMLQRDDLDTNIKSFEAAWQGLMQVLGEQGIPTAITILHDLTGGLQAMTQWAAEHPDATGNILKFAAALSAVAAVGGTLTVATAAFGPFVAALRALVGVMRAAPAAAAVAGAGGGIGGAEVAGTAALAGGASRAGRLGRLGRLGQYAGLLGLAFEAQNIGDMADQNIPGVGAVDDWLGRHVGGGMGVTYAEQARRAGGQPAEDVRPPQLAEPTASSATRPTAVAGPEGRPVNVTAQGPIPVEVRNVLHVIVDSMPQMAVNATLDGRAVAAAVADRLGRSATLPPTGTARPDPTISPGMPGFMVPGGT